MTWAVSSMYGVTICACYPRPTSTSDAIQSCMRSHVLRAGIIGIEGSYLYFAGSPITSQRTPLFSTSRPNLLLSVYIDTGAYGFGMVGSNLMTGDTMMSYFVGRVVYVPSTSPQTLSILPLAAHGDEAINTFTHALSNSVDHGCRQERSDCKHDHRSYRCTRLSR